MEDKNGYVLYETSEMCPHCNYEATFVFETDIKLPHRGIVVRCPNCNSQLILCSMCIEHNQCGLCDDCHVDVVASF